MSNNQTTYKKPRKEPLPLRFFKWVFPKIYAINSKWAGNLATWLFFKIFKFPFTEAEKEFLSSTKVQKFPYKKIEVAFYEWKNKGKPMLYFVHGWQGRAAQFRVIIDALKADYSIIAIDLPAHGQSTGRRTNIRHTAEFLHNFQKINGEPFAIVCHSFGGMATIFSRSMFNTQFEKLVTIGSPVIGQRVYEDFLRMVNLPIELSRHINDYIIKHFNVDFGSMTSAGLLNEMKKFPVLALHDRDDTDAVFEHLEYLKEHTPHVETFETEGLGHNRILRNEEVIARIREFLNA